MCSSDLRLHRERDGQRVPCVVFTKGGGLWLEDLAVCGADALGLDWTIDIGAARTQVGDQVALQGNLDPLALIAGGEALDSAVDRILAAFTARPHIFNLGHGILPETPVENVKACVEIVREFKL